MPKEDPQLRVWGLLELIQLSPLEPGSTVRVADEDGRQFRAVGNLRRDIAELISWEHSNVWMPENVYNYLLEARAGLFESPVDVAAELLARPQSLHEDTRQTGSLYVISSGVRMRERGVLTSRSVRYVDAVIEFRPVGNLVLPRLFHLSPRKRNHGGRQLWP
jgi:hypothetical protein